MSENPKKSKRKKARLDTLIDKGAELYLVRSIGDGSEAIYKKIGGGNTKLVTVQNSSVWTYGWPDILTVKKCQMYGKKIDIEQFFLDAL